MCDSVECEGRCETRETTSLEAAGSPGLWCQGPPSGALGPLTEAAALPHTHLTGHRRCKQCSSSMKTTRIPPGVYTGAGVNLGRQQQQDHHGKMTAAAAATETETTPTGVYRTGAAGFNREEQQLQNHHSKQDSIKDHRSKTNK